MNKPRWTSKQDSILRFEWGSDAAKLAAKLGRTVPAIRFRAQVLGLHLGHASGREYLTTAARRTGYSVAQLRKILVAVKVRIYSSPMGVDKRTHSVDYDDVDRAVAEWCKAEPLLMAARRWGVHPATLRRALRSCGSPLPKKPGFRKHWRIPSTTIDEAMKIRMERTA